MFTYYTIIGRRPDLLLGHLRNVTSYAGFDRLDTDKELLVIVYRNPTIPEETTNEILEICKAFNARADIYDEEHDDFLGNLYECWNLGYERAEDGLVFRGGSDQIFSKDSFVKLLDAFREKEKTGERFVLQANTIENSLLAPESRHFILPLGSTYDGFDYEKFERFCLERDLEARDSLIDINQALDIWGHPTGFNSTLGFIDRCDGCSWLMTRYEWEKYGPLPPIVRGVTGDVYIHDVMQRRGYKQYIVRGCWTYHFVRGESRDR